MFEEPYVGMPIILENNNDFDETRLDNLPLAMSYVPFQRWNNTYPLAKALERGTIFPELDLPFKGGKKNE